MSVAECIAKLVATGTVPKAIADEALDLYRRSRGEYAPHMGPASADAAAALAASRALEAGAHRLKNDAAKQALAYAKFEKTVLEYPDGPVAGVMDQLTQSLRGRGTVNADSVREDVVNQMTATWADALKHFFPGTLGATKQQIADARGLVHEIFGAATGNADLAKFAQAWKELTDKTVDRVRAAGKRFEPNESWRLPQPWQTEKVATVPMEEFRQAWKDELANGGVTRLWDRDTGKPVTQAQTDFILERAYHDILTSGGGGATFAREHRTFEFAPGQAGAESWLRMQDRFGRGGDSVVSMLTAHMNAMANEVALAEVIGPNHSAIISALLPRLKRYEAEGARRAKDAVLSLLPAGLSSTKAAQAVADIASRATRLNPVRILESASLVQKTYDVLTGRANAIDGPALAGFMGGLRNINTAAKLGGAIITSVPGDSVTAGFAATFNGMPVGRLLGGVMRELERGGAESRQLAARMQVVSHGIMDYSHGLRFGENEAGPASLRYAATLAIRAQGLQAWTELIKRVFSMEMMGHLADHAHLNFAALREANPATANMLERYGLAADWEKIRAAQPNEMAGVRFFDTANLGDEALAARLRQAINQERRYAMLEPDARIRGRVTGGLKRGTFLGDVVGRSFYQFKTFSMTLAATHVMRIATSGPIHQRLWNGAAFITMNMLAGMISMQSKALLAGKDPQDMRTAKFWAQAWATSNAMGIYGDILNSAFARTGRSIVTEFGGPSLGLAEDVTRLTSGQFRKSFEGSDTTFAAETARFGRRYTPQTFYTRLAVDRLIWDQMQMLIDPDYRDSFKRMEKRLSTETGQEYWFRPGRMPGRGPNLGAAFGD